MEQDYYELLGVSRESDEKEIKKAYKKKAMKYHPDRNPDDKDAENKFKDIQKAYSVLSNPQKKAAYDQYGHAGVDQMGSGGSSSGGGGFGDVFEDIFENIFSSGGSSRSQQSAAQRGRDLQYPLEMTLEEAAGGKKVEINVPRQGSCSPCSGTGAKKGSKPSKCETCNGVGQVRIQQGFFSIQQACPNCHGEGKVITDPCNKCHGSGRVRENKKLTVKIPAGVDEGDRVRLAGEGEAGVHGGPSGDLYVQVALKKHAIFERDENNLHCEVPIAFTTAALGGSIEVPTLSGRVTLKIPAESQSGKVFRLRGKGLESVRGYGSGDLLCKIVVETPVNLSKEQKKLLEQFENSISENKERHSPKNSTWFDSVRKFFENLKI